MRVDRRSLLRGQVARPSADQALDIQLLQTSASVENALVTAYDTILGLPVLSGTTANTLLRNLLESARAQHADHAAACNDLATRLGGRAQTAANDTLARVVAQARPRLNDLAVLVDVATQLETAATHTYQNAVGLLEDLNARRLAGSIMGVEAQHLGLLLVAKTLAGTPDLIALEASGGARLPAEAAVAGLPASFSKPEQARPPAEGALG